ncbi:LOW QUALITY PROTEIN: putative C-type lectin domain family 20 member A [Balaenoptera acutorostrata]|uniref:LOW QUALITY PROTEIN: putative C-type lectin domain family 20 member A n=1 Tax=Balaenoptera acutorostrata TaxID=9767 RepID=A0ABM3UIR3_BALAC|nr:LOW QUALITY PROTEIN: putative C-type lectin domain family 20 member A [Balaenoptera acutorostrata]
MPASGLRLSLCTAALQLTSDSKTFWRVEEELSWSEALEYCRQRHTDLAELQSTGRWSNTKTLSSLTSSPAAWIGRFFHVRLGGLRWSSSSTFSVPGWSSPPFFEEGLCATLYSITIFPSLGAASCTAQKPFICYYDPALEPHTLLELALSLTTSPKPAEVQISNLNFKRFDQERKWLAAVRYCRRHHTDLADPQTVTEETDKEALKSITSKTEAWVGLYFSAASGSLRWSSDAGASVPTWLQVPEFGAGLCVGLCSYWSFSPRISAVACSSLKPFICFDDPTIGHRESAALPQLSYTPSSEVTMGTTPRPSTLPCFLLSMGALSLFLAGFWGLQGLGSGEGGLDAAAQGSGCGGAAPAASQPGARRARPPPPRPSRFRLRRPCGATDPRDGGAQPSDPPRDPWVRPGPRRWALDPAGHRPEHVLRPRAPGLRADPRLEPRAPGEPLCPPGSDRDPSGLRLEPCSWPRAPGEPRDPGRARDAAGPSPGSTRGASAHPWVAAPPGSTTSSRSRSAELLGTGESTSEPFGSGSSAGPQRTTARREGVAPSQAARPETPGSRPEPETAVTSERSGTDMTDAATATQAQHLSSSNHPDAKENTPTPKPGQLFGILKADFLIPVLMNPEDMKDQFLSEIQEVLKLTLGHEQFRLKWVGFEVNKK